MTRASSPAATNVSTASSGVHTMGWPRTLNDVFSSTGIPLILPNSWRSVQNLGWSARATVWTRADPSTWVTAGSWAR